MNRFDNLYSRRRLHKSKKYFEIKGIAIERVVSSAASSALIITIGDSQINSGKFVIVK